MMKENKILAEQHFCIACNKEFFEDWAILDRDCAVRKSTIFLYNNRDRIVALG